MKLQITSTKGYTPQTLKVGKQVTYINATEEVQDENGNRFQARPKYANDANPTAFTIFCSANNRANTCTAESTIAAEGGGNIRVRYRCRSYVLHTGVNGGKYVMVKGKKRYIRQ
jgi:hypothetical protein